MSKKKDLKMALKVIEEIGGTVVSIRTDGWNHPSIKYQWRGKEVTFSLASTPKNQYTQRTIRDYVKKSLLKQAPIHGLALEEVMAAFR
jgi:hypothetical protein